jgi:hypothetical protein
VPRCDACVGRVMLALRKRKAEPHDPQGHVVVRVVAPRGEPDAADQSAWARRAIAKVLGPAS